MVRPGPTASRASGLSVDNPRGIGVPSSGVRFHLWHFVHTTQSRRFRRVKGKPAAHGEGLDHVVGAEGPFAENAGRVHGISGEMPGAAVQVPCSEDAPGKALRFNPAAPRPPLPHRPALRRLPRATCRHTARPWSGHRWGRCHRAVPCRAAAPRYRRTRPSLGPGQSVLAPLEFLEQTISFGVDDPVRHGDRVERPRIMAVQPRNRPRPSRRAIDPP